jgi:hypothetical protein
MLCALENSKLLLRTVNRVYISLLTTPLTMEGNPLRYVVRARDNEPVIIASLV